MRARELEPFLILAACAGLQAQENVVCLRVVGTGDTASVAEVLRGASALLLPSHQEGFGIVAAEALACGVPVVTTPTGGPEELVRGSGAGVVLEGFSPEELAGAILRGTHVKVVGVDGLRLDVEPSETTAPVPGREGREP